MHIKWAKKVIQFEMPARETLTNKRAAAALYIHTLYICEPLRA